MLAIKNGIHSFLDEDIASLNEANDLMQALKCLMYESSGSCFISAKILIMPQMGRRLDVFAGWLEFL